jgi:hypothetical protein
MRVTDLGQFPNPLPFDFERAPEHLRTVKSRSDAMDGLRTSVRCCICCGPVTIEGARFTRMAYTNAVLEKMTVTTKCTTGCGERDILGFRLVEDRRK